MMVHQIMNCAVCWKWLLWITLKDDVFDEDERRICWLKNGYNDCRDSLSLRISYCYYSLLKIIDTFHLRELHLVLINETLTHPAAALANRAWSTVAGEALICNNEISKCYHQVISYFNITGSSKTPRCHWSRLLLDQWSMAARRFRTSCDVKVRYDLMITFWSFITNQNTWSNPWLLILLCDDYSSTSSSKWMDRNSTCSMCFGYWIIEIIWVGNL